MKVLILNGPNLNMLGKREPDIYGPETLQDIQTLCSEKAKDLEIEIDFRQSNHEGTLIDWVQEAYERFDGLIINAGAYTHTSVALHDALKILNIPIIEVHISNPKEREKFRHQSYVEPLSTAVFLGHGPKGYLMALEKLAEL